MDRYTEIARRTTLKARKRLNPINRKRQAKRKAEGKVYGPYHRWISDHHGCAVFSPGDCYGDVAGHHLKTVGAGGEDAGNEIPLCAKHHTEIHAGLDDFEWRYGIIVEAEAAYLWKRYNEVLP